MLYYLLIILQIYFHNILTTYDIRKVTAGFEDETPFTQSRKSSCVCINNWDIPKLPIWKWLNSLNYLPNLF